MGRRFEPGQVVTVFRSVLRPEAADGYPDHAHAIHDLARTMPGYVDAKTFTADDGERVTVVTFADRPTHDAWRDQADHRAAQAAGRRTYYERYSIQVGTTERANEFERPPT
jgi:heme-degrading monooxygenase HmoA